MDECKAETRYQLLDALDSIISKSTNVVKILLSSRDDIDIMQHFDGCPNITVNASDNEDDIYRYTSQEVRQAIDQRRLLRGHVSFNLERDMIQKLCGQAHGMFRWVALSLQNLCDPRRMKVEEDVQNAIGRLPQTLISLYDIIFEDIMLVEERGRSIAMQIIHWLLCSQRILSSSELCSIVSGPVVVSEVEVLDLLCNLVVLDTSQTSRFFRFAHLSVREFFEAKAQFSSVRNYVVVLQRCLMSWFALGNESDENMDQPSPLEYYAAFWWPTHYQHAQDVQQVQEQIQVILSEKEYVPALQKWATFVKCEQNSRARRRRQVFRWSIENDYAESACNPFSMPSLHLSCTFGFRQVLAFLKDSGFCQWNLSTSDGPGPLELAIRCRQFHIVDFLYDCLTKPQTWSNKLHGMLLTPCSLTNANRDDPFTFVKFADEVWWARLGDLFGASSLFASDLFMRRSELIGKLRAAFHPACSKFIVSHLLANLDMSEDEAIAEIPKMLTQGMSSYRFERLPFLGAWRYLTLQQAAELLPIMSLCKSKDVPFLGDDTLLPSAAELEEGAPAALIEALTRNHWEFACFLLAHPCVPMHKTTAVQRLDLLCQCAKWHRTLALELVLRHRDLCHYFNSEQVSEALVVSASNGTSTVSEWLLNHSAVNVNHRSKNGCSALTEATRMGRRAIVELLLKRPDIDVNLGNQHGLPPLMRARIYGHSEIARLLSQRHDIDSKLKDAIRGMCLE